MWTVEAVDGCNTALMTVGCLNYVRCYITAASQSEIWVVRKWEDGALQETLMSDDFDTWELFLEALDEAT